MHISQSIEQAGGRIGPAPNNETRVGKSTEIQYLASLNFR